jgi:hypothetical protein
MVNGTAKICEASDEQPSPTRSGRPKTRQKNTGSGSHVGFGARNPLGTLRDQSSSWIRMCMVSFRERSPNDHRHKGDDDGIPEPRIAIPRLGHDSGGEEGSMPPIADVVGQRH